jgi:hypothetical protein
MLALLRVVAAMVPQSSLVSDRHSAKANSSSGVDASAGMRRQVQVEPGSCADRLYLQQPRAQRSAAAHFWIR